MKLQEGVVFTRASLSTGGGGLLSHNEMGQADSPSIGRPPPIWSTVGRYASIGRRTYLLLKIDGIF